MTYPKNHFKHQVYFHVRDHIINDLITDDMEMGLNILKGYLISHWETVNEIVQEDIYGCE